MGPALFLLIFLLRCTALNESKLRAGAGACVVCFPGYYGPVLCRIWMLMHWPYLLHCGAVRALLLIDTRLLSSSLFDSNPQMQRYFRVINGSSTAFQVWC